jgi:hypothetical protein
VWRASCGGLESSSSTSPTGSSGRPQCHLEKSLWLTLRNTSHWPWDIISALRTYVDIEKLCWPWELMLTLRNYFDLDWPGEIISAFRNYVDLEKVRQSGHIFGTWHRTDIFCASYPALPALTLKEIIPTLTQFLELYTLCVLTFSVLLSVVASEVLIFNFHCSLQNLVKEE